MPDQKDTLLPYLNDVQGVDKVEGTLYDSCLSQIGRQVIHCNPKHLSVQFLRSGFIAC